MLIHLNILCSHVKITVTKYMYMVIMFMGKQVPQKDQAARKAKWIEYGVVVITDYYRL